MGDVAFANEMRQVAQELAGDFAGQSLILRKKTEGQTLIDPDKPSLGYTQATQDYSFEGTITNFDERQIDGTNIRRDDLLCIVPLVNLTVIPDTSDMVVDGTAIYHIESAPKEQSAGVDIAYFLQLRA